MCENGFMDEKEKTKKFEALLEETLRAGQLFGIWQNSYPVGTKYDFLFGKGKKREDVFRERARQEGFGDQEIEEFLSL
jgi:hypothetical protein